MGSKPKHIYVLRCGDFYKIGVSHDPAKRIRALQTANPHEIEIVVVIELAHILHNLPVEQSLHLHFKQYRHRNEWFKLPPDALEKLIYILTG